jgi:translocation and assembly module TamB
VKRARSIFKWLGIAGISLPALVAGLAVGGLLWLQTDQGSQRLREEALAAVNGAISGRLEAERIDINPGGWVAIRGARLLDPEGKLIARIGALQARVALAGLARKRVLVQSLQLEDAELHLANGPDGLNIARAFAPRHPKPKTASGPFDWHIDLSNGAIEGLAFSYRTAPGAEPVSALSGTDLALAGRYAPGELKVRLRAKGQMSAPLATPFLLAIDTSGGSAEAPYEPLRFEKVGLIAGGSMLDLAGGLAHGKLQVDIRDAKVQRELLLQLAPGAPLATDLRLHGNASLDSGKAVAKLEVGAGQGTLAIDASANLSPLDARAVVGLKQADLSAIVRGAPASQLNGTVDATWRMPPGAPGNGGVVLKLERSQVERATVESAHAEADWDGKAAHVKSLSVGLPGGTLEASGTLDSERIDARASLAASDIRTLSRGVARYLDAEAPPVSGKGTTRVSVSGPWKKLEVQVAGDFDRVEAGAIRFDGLSLKGRLPDLSRPFLLAADVHARFGRLGALPFRALEGKVEADRRDFSAELTTRGLAGVKAQVKGAFDPGGESGRIASLALATDDARWELQEPARIDMRDGFRVDRLLLFSGQQKIELRGGLSGNRLDGDARVEHLDLAALPQLLVPKEWKLAGQVDAHAQVGGTTSRPHVQAELSGEGLGYQEISGVQVEGRVGLGADERLAGNVSIGRGAAHAAASFDLPLALFDASPGTALSARVDLKEASLAELGSLLGFPELKAGLLSGRIDLSGSSDRPGASARLRVTGGQYAELPVSDLELVASSDEASKAHLEAGFAEGHAVVDLKAGIDLGALVRARPGPGGWTAVPLELRIDAPGIRLDLLPESLLGARLGGRISVRSALTGSLRAPRGIASLEVADGSWEEWQKVSGSLQLGLEESAVGLKAALQEDGEPLASLDARLDSPLEQLLSLEGLQTAPLDASLKLGALGIQKLAPKELEGRVEAQAKLRGTLGAPLLDLDASGAGLAYAGKPLGDLSAKAGYAAGKTELDAALRAAGGGQVNVTGKMIAKLGLDELRSGLELKKAPIAGTIHATALDLAPLERFVPDFRRTGGTVAAQLVVHGTLESPLLEGTASLRDGRMTVLGYGSFRDVTADLQFAERAIDLTKLSAKAGNGSVELTARAERPDADSPYRMNAGLKLDRFPLRINDKNVATLSGSTERWTGEIQGLRIAFDVKLARLVAELPALGGKDLQALDPHPGIRIGTGEERPEKIEKVKKGEGDGEDSGLDLRLHVQAPRNLWVESADAKIEAGADLTLSVAEGKTEISGKVTTRSGQADVLGRRFELARGQISWAGDPPANPKLDITATHENSREQVKVKVTITGDAQKPRIDLSSEPPLDDQEIAILLATGRRELKRGSGGVASGGSAASLIGSFAADRLRKTISSKLPLDVLQFEMGEEGIQSSRLEAGTYVTDDIYVGYRRNFGADLERENGNEVRIEYELGKGVTVESQYGDAEKGGLDVVYSKEY